ncbi:hypothetical protein EVAR_59624_1 [Eumeta japonica]|uniref:DUF4806 domain-containing protein n=1 Tax=Eumeta variegata TaxID=151549 RepID=A0A4C1ZEB7_EUMVA|nr:hypothetical protein EVAR_59624_1 [Eumeta japonica]
MHRDWLTDITLSSVPSIRIANNKVLKVECCETLESARKAADDSQYSSTAEMVGRGYRSRKISSVRRALNLKKKPNIISRSDDDSFKVIKETAAGSQNDDSITENNRNWNTVEKKLDCCLRLLRKLVVDVTDLKQRSVSNNGNSRVNSAISEEVDTYLKLNTRDAVIAFEEKLATSTAFENEFTRKVKQVGGSNGKDFTERALAFTFTDNFAKDNTWEGKITKYKVNNLKVVAICEKIVFDKYPSFDKNEFSKAGTNWFRLGNQRAGSQPKQMLKKMASAQTNADATERNSPPAGN